MTTTIPAGWKLLAKKTCYVLVHDGSVIATLAGPESEANAAIIARILAAPSCPTCNDQGAVGNILTAQPCPDCAAPGVSTVEAQPVAWMDPDTQDVISAERKASWLNEYGAGGAAKAATYTRALGDLRPAPAAGDARELLGALIDARRELHACQAVIHYAGGFDPAYVRDAQAAIKRADAAIAAQQGQDGR